MKNHQPTLEELTQKFDLELMLILMDDVRNFKLQKRRFLENNKGKQQDDSLVA